MVKYMLQITAVLENLTKLGPVNGCDDDGVSYFFKIECETCGAVTEDDVRLCLKDEVLVPEPIWNGGATTNFVHECKVCEKSGTILMIPGGGHPLPCSFGEPQRYTTIMVFDCDGVKPMSFSLHKTPWEAEFIMTGEKIINIYISDGEYASYKEHANQIIPTSIWSAKSKFVKSE